jgi:transcriptional regulator with XRE-family HTH domain
MKYIQFISQTMENNPNQSSESVADNIKKIRQEQGLSQSRLAAMLDVSIPTISKIENGFTDINLSRIYQIAQAYQISVVQLLEGDSTRHEEKRMAFDLRKIEQKVAKRNAEISNLRRKIIELNEELYNIRKKNELKQSAIELEFLS